MKREFFFILTSIIINFTACDAPVNEITYNNPNDPDGVAYNDGVQKQTYTVTYNGNGSSGGTVPVDTTNYEQGQTVTVLGNTGSLVKTGYSFTGWNTLANGTGTTTYLQGQTLIMGTANVTLYAKWVLPGDVATVDLAIISYLYSPQKLCIDNNYIYWTEYGGNAGGNIKKISKNGGSVFILISGLSNPSGLSMPVDIAVDSSSVYWTDLGTNASGAGLINKIPLINSNITLLANNLTTPRGIAVDSSYLYWADEGGSSIKRILIGGGTIDNLASGLNQPSDVALDDSYVYWVENAGTSVKKASKIDKFVTVLTSGLPCTPVHLKIDDSNVYWSDGAFGASCGVKKISKSGGTITSLILNLTGSVYNLSTDGNYVYYIEAGTRIMKIGVGGGSPSIVADNLDSAFDLSVDDTYVYWIENGNNTRRIAKKFK